MAPRPESPDFHERLGVDSDASKEEINQAFRTLAKEYHPEAGGDTEIFQRLSEAKTALVPPENRGSVGEGEVVSEAETETETRITELKKELKEKETERTPETKLAPPGGEPPEEEGDGGGGGGRLGGSQEWRMEYAPCPTCYKKLRYMILRCPQCKGKGSIPKSEWHRVSEN